MKSLLKALAAFGFDFLITSFVGESRGHHVTPAAPPVHILHRMFVEGHRSVRALGTFLLNRFMVCPQFRVDQSVTAIALLKLAEDGEML